MPRKAKTTEPEAVPAEAKPARGAKTAAVKAALKAHKNKFASNILRDYNINCIARSL